MWDFIGSYVDPDEIAGALLAFMPGLVVAILIVLGFWLLSRITSAALRAAMGKAGFESRLIHLLVNNVYRPTIVIIGLVMAASQLGVNVAAALAGIGVAGVAIGLAAQETLANVIAGFLIFWDKPFKVGDYVTVQGEYGRVVDITMRTTRIRTQNNTYMILPNKQIMDNALVNHTKHGAIRIDVPIGIAYKENIPEARRVLLEAIRVLPHVIADPPPDVVTKELAASSIDLLMRVWIDDASKERPTYYRVVEAGKLALDAAGIQIPYHHMQLFIDDVEDRVWQKAAGLVTLGGPNTPAAPD
jgi:small conductance mechanosensitive channel